MDSTFGCEAPSDHSPTSPLTSTNCRACSPRHSVAASGGLSIVSRPAPWSCPPVERVFGPEHPELAAKEFQAGLVFCDQVLSKQPHKDKGASVHGAPMSACRHHAVFDERGSRLWESSQFHKCQRSASGKPVNTLTINTSMREEPGGAR